MAQKKTYTFIDSSGNEYRFSKDEIFSSMNGYNIKNTHPCFFIEYEGKHLQRKETFTSLMAMRAASYFTKIHGLLNVIK